MHTANPDAEDLRAFLGPVMIVLGRNLPATIDYQTRIDAARNYIEGQIGRTLLPSTQTRKYDPPTNVRATLDLQADFLSISSLTVQGKAFVADTDYILEPYNADVDGKPFRWIVFLQPTWPFPILLAQRRSVVITGVVGMAATMQAQAWDAILCQGAINCYPELALSISRGRQMQKEGDVEEMYARGQNTGPLLEEREAWALRVSQAITNLQVVEVGL